MQQLTVTLTQWYYTRRSDGTYVVVGTGKGLSKFLFDVSDHIELYTCISPKDKGDHFLFDLPGTYKIKCFKADKKKDKPDGTPAKPVA